MGALSKKNVYFHSANIFFIINTTLQSFGNNKSIIQNYLHRVQETDLALFTKMKMWFIRQGF